MTAPRAMTVEEMREKFLDQCRAIADFWASVDLRSKPANETEAQYRLNGLLFSLFVILDGGSADLPAFDLTPSPHPSDEEYHRDEGENWWAAKAINADCQLHELLAARERKSR